MTRIVRSTLTLALLAPWAAAVAGTSPSAPALSAEQVIEKNVAARGGLQAWRAVRTMSFAGKMDAGGKNNPQVPFLLELKRTRKSRLEIDFADDKAIQVYDGAAGWKLRPFLGRRDIEPFTQEEAQSAAAEFDLDGPLVDYTQKGTKVELEGMDRVEDRDTYKLKLTVRGGHVRRLWIDAKTFLEAKIEGVPRRLDGKLHPVEIYYRDYRPVSGLIVPYALETVVGGVKRTPGQPPVPSRKMTIENVVVNPELDDVLFTKPSLDVTTGKAKPGVSS
jgi:hypothetical protein